MNKEIQGIGATIWFLVSGFFTVERTLALTNGNWWAVCCVFILWVIGLISLVSVLTEP